MLGPHMHAIGTQIRFEHTPAGGERACLIEDPHWDADWQSVYVIEGGVEQHPSIAPGDVLRLTCTYDNSLNNPSLVEALEDYGLDSPITVGMGSAGLDEMCMFVYGLAFPR